MNKPEKLAHHLQLLRIIYLLGGAGCVFIYIYFLDKSFTWQTIVEDSTKVRLYVGGLLALFSALAIEALILRITGSAYVSVFIVILRWLALLVLVIAYVTVNHQ